jgi:beta-N-acetylhexosaminidase
MIPRFPAWLFLPALLLSCGPQSQEGASRPLDAVPPPAEAPPPGEFAVRRERARRIAASLDDRLLAAQVIITGIDGAGALGEVMERLLRAVPAGSIMLFKYNLSVKREAIPPFLKGCSDLIAGIAGIPPFIAVDHEGGSVHRFGPGVGRLPPPGAYWEEARARGWDYALRAVEDDARRSGLELRELGISLNLAPVAEVLTGENRAFLGDRSYGPSPAFTEAAAGAFIRGMAAAGIPCVIKHFPGNTGVDPHGGALTLGADSAELAGMVRPFAALIRGDLPPENAEAGVREAPAGVMVSHALVPLWDGERIASLSKRVMGEHLRGEMGFDGIILGDDFSMGAALVSGMSPEAAAVEALIAGADMVMAWPGSLKTIHGAILKGLSQGRLSRERLEDAAARIIYTKIRYELFSGECSGLEGE